MRWPQAIALQEASGRRFLFAHRPPSIDADWVQSEWEQNLRGSLVRAAVSDAERFVH